MVLGKQMNTRVSPEAFKAMMQKCADRGCSTYEYLRQLVHEDVGLDVDGNVPEEPHQTELTENERAEGRITVLN